MATDAEKAKVNRVYEELKKGDRKLDQETIDLFARVFPDNHVRIKVISQKGLCFAGHKVGDEWEMKGIADNYRCPSICYQAFGVMYADVKTLMYGGSYPWESDSNVTYCVCPDTRNTVTFELRRIPKPA